MTFHLGCAIWAYKDWIGELFPAQAQAKDLLALYSRRFNTVEGNTTFYSIPSAETLHRWQAETPAGFKFCLKLPRDLTHRGWLMPQLPATIAFVEQMQILGDRLGVFFAQLPPSYGPSQLPDLTQFLQAFPRDRAELALEVRHLDWFIAPHAAELNAILQDLGVGRVLLDTRPIYDCPDDPQLASERRKPKLPLQPIVTAPFSLIRYISHPDRDFNQPYLEGWTQQVAAWLAQDTRIYFFVHCPIEQHSPANARQFQALLEAAQVPVPPLPWNAIAPEAPPTQLRLFE